MNYAKVRLACGATCKRGSHTKNGTARGAVSQSFNQSKLRDFETLRRHCYHVTKLKLKIALL